MSLGLDQIPALSLPLYPSLISALSPSGEVPSCQREGAHPSMALHTGGSCLSCTAELWAVRLRTEPQSNKEWFLCRSAPALTQGKDGRCCPAEVCACSGCICVWLRVSTFCNCFWLQPIILGDACHSISRKYASGLIVGDCWILGWK